MENNGAASPGRIPGGRSRLPGELSAAPTRRHSAVVVTRPGRPAPSQGSRTRPRSAAPVPFSRFTIQMLEQSLREEDLRARHQAALLRLREKALEEKMRAELAWLEHQRG